MRLCLPTVVVQPVGLDPFGKPLSPEIFTLQLIAQQNYSYEVAAKIMLRLEATTA